MPEPNKTIRYRSLLIFVILTCCIEIISARTPFPQLTDSAQPIRRAHIISEVTREGEPKYILEEYIDFLSSTEHLVKTSLNDKQSFLIDGTLSTIFNFKPYNCELLKSGDLFQRLNFKGIWTSNFAADGYLLDKFKKSLPLVGVSAIWLNAARKSKIYNQLSIDRHSWLTVDTEINSKISLIFHDNYSDIQLKSIEFEDITSKKITSLINVISVDYTIPIESHKIFNLPVIYGCARLLKDMAFSTSIVNDEHDGELEKLNVNFASSFEINMEISITSFIGNNDMRSINDVIDMVVAAASLEDLHVQSKVSEKNTPTSIDVKLIHARGFRDKTATEMKQILDYSTNVKYLINASTNECTQERIGLELSKNVMQLTFKNNNITLTIDDMFIKKLLEDSIDFILTSRWTSEDKSMEYLHYEKEESGHHSMFGGKQTTIEKTYIRSYEANVSGEKKKNINSARLHSINVIIYNDNRSKIEDVYQFMITSYKTELTLKERAKLFDLSVCFKESDKHSWIDINYPLNFENIPDLSNYFYRQHSNREKLQLNFLRVPKIEQTYEDYSVVIRALLLDTQPDPLVQFNAIRELSFKEDKNENIDQLHIAATIEQCSNICKMSNCHMFSYCMNYECKVSWKKVSAIDAKNSYNIYDTDDDLSLNEGTTHSTKRFIRDWSCTLYVEDATYINATYLSNVNKMEQYNKMRPLQDILAQLSHDDYYLHRPPASESSTNSISDYDDPELSLRIPNFWTGQKNRIVQKYSDDIELVPISIQIENDPLNDLLSDELNIQTNTQYFVSRLVAPTFHNSLGRKRFKVEIDTNFKRSNQKPVVIVEPNEDDNSPLGISGELIVIEGQTYDECVTLCIDRGLDCGSFSFCHYDGQCITSGLYDKKTILDNSISDSQCTIVQRDFLSKFTRTQELVYRPIIWNTDGVAKENKTIIKHKESDANDEHDCAYQCIIEKDFSCLSFDYCIDQSRAKTKELSTSQTEPVSIYDNNNLGHTDDNLNYTDNEKSNICTLHSVRNYYDYHSIRNENSKLDRSKRNLSNCWYHQRSHLADFNRLDHRDLMQAEEYRNSFVSIVGANVDECATQCYSKPCNMFQFCYDSNVIPHQLCFIASDPMVNLSKSSFVHKSNCYIYTLKNDITSKYAYINSRVDKKQLNEDEVTKDTTSSSMVLMLFTTILTFVTCLTIGAIIVIQKQYREQIEQRFQRMKAMWF